jgi:hypothetical protein
MDQPNSEPGQRRAFPRRIPKSGTRVVCRKGTLGLSPNLALSLIDLSEWGVSLLIKGTLRQGDEVEVALSAPGCGRDIVRFGDVVWTLAGPDGTCRVGVRLQKRIEFSQLQDLGRPSGG